MAQNKAARNRGVKPSLGVKASSEIAPILLYRNPALPPRKRLRDLLSRMTLEEKAAQMLCIWQKKPQTLVDADGNFDLAKARQSFKEGHGLGQVGRPSDAGKGLGARQMLVGCPLPGSGSAYPRSCANAEVSCAQLLCKRDWLLGTAVR